MNFFEKLKQLKQFDSVIAEKTKELKELENSIYRQSKLLDNLKEDTEKAKQIKEKEIEERDNEKAKTKEKCEDIINSYKDKTEEYSAKYSESKTQYDKLKKESDLFAERIKLYKSFIRNASKHILTDNDFPNDVNNNLCPTVELHLNSFDVNDLRKLINENKKLTDVLLKKYEKRYTTKANKAIYQLMVLALRAELQNILIDLKYSNIDKCKANLKNMINTFMAIASDGNQSIAPTLKSFINEVNILFDQAIDIEYTYFVRKEQVKAEQQALKEQMQQEAAERKALELEHQKIEKEESKYKAEISNTEQQLNDCKDDEKTKQLLARIEELKKLLERVEERKEEIINRQNGKAGYVYIISNLGSFGDKCFKIGMTRRLEPMDRVKELGDASVPFSFDVHSFIFSEDAVSLESELHKRLSSKRTNKINLRKEFFNISLNEVKELVNEICPSAEFKETMLAIEYRKGLEIAV